MEKLDGKNVVHPNPKNVQQTLHTDPSVNCGLGVILFHRSWQMHTPVGEVDTGGGSHCEGAQGVWEVSVSSAQFCCKPKTALKNSLLYIFKYNVR